MRGSFLELQKPPQIYTPNGQFLMSFSLIPWGHIYINLANPRFFKEVLGMKKKRKHSRGAHLGCKQGRLKYRVLILGGEDVVDDCQK